MINFVRCCLTFFILDKSCILSHWCWMCFAFLRRDSSVWVESMFSIYLFPFSPSPSLSLSTPLHPKHLFFQGVVLTREERWLILPWNSGQYTGSVLGYLIRSRYLSIASTPKKLFSLGKVCVGVCAAAVLLIVTLNRTYTHISRVFLDADESKAADGPKRAC